MPTPMPAQERVFACNPNLEETQYRLVSGKIYGHCSSADLANALLLQSSCTKWHGGTARSACLGSNVLLSTSCRCCSCPTLQGSFLSLYSCLADALDQPLREHLMATPDHHKHIQIPRGSIWSARLMQISIQDATSPDLCAHSGACCKASAW